MSMKRFELFFTFLQLPIDFLLLILAGCTAYALRFSEKIMAIRPVFFHFNLPWQRFLEILLFVALGWIVVFIFSGLYSTNPNRKFSSELTRIIMACSTSFAGITIYVFFTLQRFDSRFLVVAGWIAAIIYISLGRLLLRGLKSLLYRLGIGLRRTVIIGDESIASIIVNTLKAEPRRGYVIVGQFGSFTDTTKKSIRTLAADEIILTTAERNEAETLAAIDFANQHHLSFKYSADLFATITTNMSVSTIAGIPIIELGQTRLSGWGRIIKRGIDITGALLLIILSSPIYLLISLAILIETGRPILYRNRRVGQNSREFYTLKFRSMYQKDCTGEEYGPSGIAALQQEKQLIKKHSVKAGPVYKIKDDPRVTPLGRWLRRWSLDELPQFLNVFSGDMSLVGPRPHQPREVAKYQTHHRVVLAIKPGISGLAQISGRSNLSFEEEVKLDTFYIERWNLYLDIIILLKTPFIVLFRKGGAW